MPVLVDTNVLLRAVQPSHPMHPFALRALATLFAGSDPLVIAIQNVAEFWNAATRPPAVNGLGMTIDQVRGEVKRLEGFFEIVSESADSCGLESSRDDAPRQRRSGSRRAACRRDDSQWHYPDFDLQRAGLHPFLRD